MNIAEEVLKGLLEDRVDIKDIKKDVADFLKNDYQGSEAVLSFTKDGSRVKANIEGAPIAIAAMIYEVLEQDKDIKSNFTALLALIPIISDVDKENE